MMDYCHVFIFSSLLVSVFAAYLKPSRPIPDTWFKHNAFIEEESTVNDENEDLNVEASERKQDHENAMSQYHPGRVQIKVYRGPYDEHEHFAPHGFWVKQPADDQHSH